MLQTPESELDENLAGVEDELLFHILTNPQLRSQFVDTGEMAEEAEGPVSFDIAAGGEAAGLNESFQALPGLSDRIKGRLG